MMHGSSIKSSINIKGYDFLDKRNYIVMNRKAGSTKGGQKNPPTTQKNKK